MTEDKWPRRIAVAAISVVLVVLSIAVYQGRDGVLLAFMSFLGAILSGGAIGYKLKESESWQRLVSHLK